MVPEEFVPLVSVHVGAVTATALEYAARADWDGETDVGDVRGAQVGLHPPLVSALFGTMMSPILTRVPLITLSVVVGVVARSQASSSPRE